MNEFKNLEINELINRPFKCDCGQLHQANIRGIEIGEGVLKKLPDYIRSQELKNSCLLNLEKPVYIVADLNTWEAAGERLAEILNDANLTFKKVVIPYRDVHAEWPVLEYIEKEIPKETELVIALGSGTINDLVKYLSYKRDIPYYIVATAPSMDGFASSASPIVWQGIKRTFEASPPELIIGDTEIFKEAPQELINAGLGDLVGKYNAITDWKLSAMINKETYCPDVADLVLRAVDTVLNSLESVKRREPEGLTRLMVALVLVGLAMSFIGNTRPASSSEHHLAHVMEHRSIMRGEYGDLHGACVGMSSLLIGRLYEKFLTMDIEREKAKKQITSFDNEKWLAGLKELYGNAYREVVTLQKDNRENTVEQIIKRMEIIIDREDEIKHEIKILVENLKKGERALTELGAPVNLKDFDYSPEEYRLMFLYAKDIRKRYGALQIFYDLGILEKLADEILAEEMNIE